MTALQETEKGHLGESMAMPTLAAPSVLINSLPLSAARLHPGHTELVALSNTRGSCQGYPFGITSVTSISRITRENQPSQQWRNSLFVAPHDERCDGENQQSTIEGSKNSTYITTIYNNHNTYNNERRVSLMHVYYGPYWPIVYGTGHNF